MSSLRNASLFIALLWALPISAHAVTCGPELADAPTRLDQWITEVKAQPTLPFSLPYEQTPRLSGQLLPLQIEINSTPSPKIFLAFFEKEQGVIPAERKVESWHAIIRHFEGYFYYLSFSSATERSQFLSDVCNQVFLPKGELFAGQLGSNDQFGLFMTMEQFLQLSERVGVRELIPNERMFVPIARRDIENFESLLPSTSGDTTYYFDSRQQLKAMRQRGKFYVYSPPTFQQKSEVTSHIAILARQNPRLDITRFQPRFDGEDMALGMASARTVVASLTKEVNEFLVASGRGQLLSEIQQLEKNIADAIRSEDQATRELADKNSTLQFYLPRLLAKQAQIYQEYLASGVTSEHATLLKSFSLNFKNTVKAGPESGTSVHRFVWLKGMAIPMGGILLGQRDHWIHEQLLLLALGERVYEKLAHRSSLRGGILKVDYDAQGKPKKFTIVPDKARMHATIDGKVEEIQLMDAERRTLELMMYNATRG